MTISPVSVVRPEAGRAPSSEKTAAAWPMARGLVLGLSALVLAALALAPRIGLHALWNLWVPAAPALLLLWPGLWRNVCPLATVAGWSARRRSTRRRLSRGAQDAAVAGGVALFFLIVPLRHVILDRSATATLAVVVALGAAALVLAHRFESRSAWCQGLCPVHPAERLYGTNPAATFRNASCASCTRCTVICPDSDAGVHALTARRGSPRRVATTVFAGGLPGFIVGWFHVPDFAASEGWRHLALAYGLPLGGAIASLPVFLAVQRAAGAGRERQLARLAGGLAVVLYYAHRLPALAGGGVIPGDGMLADLRGVLPPVAFDLLSLAPFFLFGVWLVAIPTNRRSWCVPPPRVGILRHGIRRKCDRQPRAPHG